MMYICISVIGNNYTPLFNEVEGGGGILVSPCLSICSSICGQNRVPLYLPQYKPHPFHDCTYYQATSEGVSRVEIFLNFKIIIFANFFKIVTLTLACVHVIWMFKFIPDLSFYCSHFKFSMMIPVDGVLNISSRFGQIHKFLFFAFFNCAFHLVFVVATTNLSFYCSHFEWPAVWHAGVSWPLQNWLDFGDHLLIFLILTSLWLSETGQLPNIFWRTQGRNGLNFGMRMYSDHLQNLSNFVPGLLIFLIMASFWLRDTGQIWGFWCFSSECMGGMAWNLTCACILTTFSTAYILVRVCWFFLIMVVFWLSEASQIYSFWAFSWECIGVIGWTCDIRRNRKGKFQRTKNYPVTDRGIPDCYVVRPF